MSLLQWVQSNYIELLGTFFGFAYLYFSIRQKAILWLFGLLSSVLYVVIFAQSRFYAGMLLQVYYVGMSIYGWLLWKGFLSKKDTANELVTRKTACIKHLYFITIVALFTLVLGFMLDNYTNSYVPYGDAFTFAGGMVATWMLAQKYLENWLYWIVIDSFSVYLYFSQQLKSTAVLFIVYTIMAVLGYFEWKKSFKQA
jgi:nicotinamide mononucleotide transporter